MPLTRTRTADRQSGATSDRLRELLRLHSHPERRSRYWLRRQERLGWDVHDRVRSLEDLGLLGPTPVDDLRRYPLADFVPGRCTVDGRAS